MKTIKLFFVLCSFLTLLNTSYANPFRVQGETFEQHNPMPSDCSDSFSARRNYESGRNILIRSLLSYWKSFNKDCDRIEEFQGMFEDLIDRFVSQPINTPSNHLACRISGTVMGYNLFVEHIYNKCECRCSTNGQAMGKFFAKAYCRLSEALNGLNFADDFLPAPYIKFCGLNYSMGCRTQFLKIASNTCTEYAVNPFDRIMASYQNQQCEYHYDENDY